MKDNFLNFSIKVINYFYVFQLLNEEWSSKKAFEEEHFSEKELKLIEKFIESKPKLEKTIKKYLKKSWTWDRINPLEQVILLYGSFCMQFLEKALVINEMIVITKELVPDDSYKYVNYVLDQVRKDYERIKRN